MNAEHAADLVDFARASRHPLGFGWLDDDGVLDPSHPIELWINCRMTHVFGLESLRRPRTFGTGEQDSRVFGTGQRERELAEHGVDALLGPFHDVEHGGWFASIDRDGPVDPSKPAYAHVFVILAGATAAGAGIPRGRELLDAALAIFDEHLWREEDGLVVDLWDRTWTELEGYRGANANMHAVEALLAAYDVTGDPRRLDQARRITDRIIGEFAAGSVYRLCEHYSPTWTPMPDYNHDDPAHQFRPYGVTIGHLFEWARLSLHVRTAAGIAGPDVLLKHAEALFERAVEDGWAVDGADGLVYTTDFDGVAVVRERIWWVVSEALAAAHALFVATENPDYAEWEATWWEYADEYLIDGGSWRHELDPTNRPAATVWAGRPDTYHVYQATILPSLPAAASFIGALTGASPEVPH